MEKVLEEAIRYTHIYERYCDHGFEGKDEHPQTSTKRQPSVLIEEEYDQLKKEGNESPLGLKWVVSMFGISFTFLIVLDLD